MEERVPLAVGLLVGLLSVLTGAAVSAVNRRAADGRLRRNPVAGIRTRATMRSDAAWTAGHSAAQGSADAAAVVFALTGLAATVVRDAPRFAGVVILGTCVGAGVLLAGARRAGLAADRADGP